MDKEFDLWVLLLRTYHLLNRLRRYELQQYDIPPSQAFILVILQALGGETTQAKINQYAYQQRSSISELLKRMEKRGLISKTKRSSLNANITVNLTEKGYCLLHDVMKRESIHRAMSVLTEERRSELESSLKLLRNKAVEELIYHKEDIAPSTVLIEGV